MNKIVDAVSIVLVCEDEIFIIQRQNYLKAFPGYFAFPGGKVEKTDEEYFLENPLLDGFNKKIIGALFREGFEELGVDLRDQIKNANVKTVNLLGSAVTPDFNPFRFETYFFKIELVSKINFKVDYNEAKFSTWIKPEELFKLYESGEILAVPPVIKVIETLATNQNAETIKNLNFHYDSTKYVPYIESIKSVRQIMPLSNTLPPASRTNAFLIGDGHSPKILIDPSPRNDEYEKFANTIALFGVDKIMLTHHHFDHHENAVRLAKELNVPMGLSKDSYQRIKKIRPDYFESVKVDFLKEGDVVTRWLGEEVCIYEVPGHDEGQLAVAPRNLNWFLAGDLFQGVGTVVIGGDEGDMSKYFHTLEKVITLNPKVLFPSHGIALGGVDILERTLEHRKVRENQVLTLKKQGKSLDEILNIIYFDVSENLKPYAKQNILKHLDKLRKEEKIDGSY